MNNLFAGELCESQQCCVAPVGTANGYLLPLPARNVFDGAQFLDDIGAGMLGSSSTMLWMGHQIPIIRNQYEQGIQELAEEVAKRKALKQSAEEIARYAVRERRNIALRTRARLPISLLTLEVRDWHKYGIGGRTYRNVSAYTSRKYGLSGTRLQSRLIKGALSSNAAITQKALRGARYLRHGGRILVPLSLAVSGAYIASAPEGEMERVIHEEVGAFTVGAVTTMGAVAVFGIVTGGWGLLAIGVIAGVAGGIGGGEVGRRLYYSKQRNIERKVNQTGQVDYADMMIAP